MSPTSRGPWKAGTRLAGLVIVALLALSSAPSACVTALRAEAQALQPQRLSFEVLSLPWFSLSDKAAEVVAEQLRRIGVEIKLVRLESSIMYPRIMNTFDYDSFALAVSQSPDPTGMIDSFHSRNAVPGGSNYWGYNVSEVDRLIDSLYRARSLEEAKPIAWQIQKAASTGPFMPLYLSINTQVIRADWKNYTTMPGGILEVYNRWSALYMYRSERPEENVLRMGFPSDILSLNPFMANDLRSLWVLGLMYEPLVAFSPDLKVVPWLAEGWDVSPDGLVYTFHLKKGVRFHDGAEMTADDVVFTYAYGISNKATRFRGPISQILERVEKADSYTVRFVLKSPSPFFLINLASGLQFIVPRHVWEGQKVDWANPSPVGTGPFVLSSRKPGEGLVLARNPEYHVPGAPRISQIVVRVVPEAETRYYMIRRGELDAERYSTSYTLVRDAEKDPSLKVVRTPDIWLVYMAFNYRRYNDTRIFEAINYAINRTEVIERAAGGYGIPVYTVLNKEWHGDFANANVSFAYDPQRASKILEEAGWVPGPDGIRIYRGAPPPATAKATETAPQAAPPQPSPAVVAAAAAAAIAVVISLALLRLRRGR